MRVSRTRGDILPRTLSPRELPERLDTLLRRSGKEAFNKLRDDIRSVAQQLGTLDEDRALDDLMAALLGTRDAHVVAPTAKARQKGRPYDPERIVLFERLCKALQEYPPVSRVARVRPPKDQATLAFFEAYFSNFLEGTEFAVEEAADIVVKGVIPNERPEDAHDA